MAEAGRPPIRFDGQAVIVTGAGRGLGAAYARLLAARGAAVVVHDAGVAPDGSGFDPAVADGAVRDIVAQGGTAVADHENLESADGCRRLVEQAIDRFGRVDALIHNAGLVIWAPVEEMDEVTWNRMVRLGVDASFHLVRAVLPHMKRRRYGRIVLTTSGRAMRVEDAAPGLVGYAMGKMAQIGLMVTLARETEEAGIRVNAVSPVAATRVLRRSAPDLRPEHVAPGVVFLASSACDFSGAVLRAAAGDSPRPDGVPAPRSTSGPSRSIPRRWPRAGSRSAGRSDGVNGPDPGEREGQGRAGIGRRLARERGAVVGLVILGALVLMALGAPWLSPRDPIRTAAREALQAPGARFVLGSDQFGRDVASRVLHGARISLTVGLISVSIAVALGAPLGLVSGYYGGRLDTLIMRVMDVLLAFPGILLALAIVSVLTPGLTNVMIAVGLSAVPAYARLVRATALSARENLYVEAARALGRRDLSILSRYILPNVVAPLIVTATLGLGTAIISAAALSFLGLGSQPPQPEWGRMLSEGRDYLREAWWISTFPGLGIMLTVLAMNLLGDGLRDVLDPRLRA